MITSSEYWKEVENLAKGFKESHTEEEIQDPYEILHEMLDSHQWCIYNAYYLSILQHSDNENYAIEEGLVDLDFSHKANGIYDILRPLAFWAFHQDVLNKLNKSEDVENLHDEDDIKAQEA